MSHFQLSCIRSDCNMNCVCAGYIREVTIHSKKYKRDEMKFTHYVHYRCTLYTPSKKETPRFHTCKFLNDHIGLLCTPTGHFKTCN